jgi:hypothetical protein
MSSAFYPQGMNSWNNRKPQGGYKTWKGKGVFSNPVGVTATHVRPLTNNDPGNVFPTGFGLSRPIKHYRKGTVIPVYVPLTIFTDTEKNRLATAEKSLIEYNINRAVKSSTGATLGGGSGGSGLISQMMDGPGQFIVKDNGQTAGAQKEAELIGTLDGDGNLVDVNRIDADCRTCNGIGVVSSWYPINNLTEKPEPNTTNGLLCCNEQRKARRRVLPTSTNVKKNYYQTTDMYLYNRCQTFEQREFNFLTGPTDPNIEGKIEEYPLAGADIISKTKPGDPLSGLNYYVAQCNPNSTIDLGGQIAILEALARALVERGIIDEIDFNTFRTLRISTIPEFISEFLDKLPKSKRIAAGIALDVISANPYLNSLIYAGPSNPRGCKRVYYKPNNAQFAQQGAVSSSTKTLKTNVDTISTNAAKIRRLKGANIAPLLFANGDLPDTPFIYKFKVPTCQASTFVGNPFFFQGQHQNKKICSKRGADNDRLFVSVYQHSAGNYIGSTQP